MEKSEETEIQHGDEHSNNDHTKSFHTKFATLKGSRGISFSQLPDSKPVSGEFLPLPIAQTSCTYRSVVESPYLHPMSSGYTSFRLSSSSIHSMDVFERMVGDANRRREKKIRIEQFLKEQQERYFEQFKSKKRLTALETKNTFHRLNMDVSVRKENNKQRETFRELEETLKLCKRQVKVPGLQAQETANRLILYGKRNFEKREELKRIKDLEEVEKIERARRTLHPTRTHSQVTFQRLTTEPPKKNTPIKEITNRYKMSAPNQQYSFQEFDQLILRGRDPIHPRSHAIGLKLQETNN